MFAVASRREAWIEIFVKRLCDEMGIVTSRRETIN